MSLSEREVWSAFVVIGKSVSHLTPMQTSKRVQMTDALPVPTSLHWWQRPAQTETSDVRWDESHLDWPDYSKMQNRKLDKEQHMQTT